MSTTDSLALIGSIVVVIVPLAGLIWYIINHRSEWKKIVLAGVVTVLVMAALLAGVNAVASQHSKSTPLPGTTQAVTALTTASPTPVVTTITENRSIPCGQSSCTVMIILDKVAIDTSQRNMSWTFTLSSGSGCNVELDLSLEDPNGTKYQGGGQVGPLAPGQTIASGHSVDVVALFALVPTPGVTYQLLVGISGLCNAPYQTESFTF
jgi:hypothetical protein